MAGLKNEDGEAREQIVSLAKDLEQGPIQGRTFKQVRARGT